MEQELSHWIFPIIKSCKNIFHQYLLIYHFYYYRKIEHLENLIHLKSLILDNNEIQELRHLQCQLNVETLWLNNNNIYDLEDLLDNLQKKFPNLRYLSMINNPCCPSVLDTTYQRYRNYIIYRLKSLKFLDFREVTDIERKSAKEWGKNKFICRMVVPNHMEKKVEDAIKTALFTNLRSNSPTKNNTDVYDAKVLVETMVRDESYLLPSRYEIVSLMGSGSLGEVCKASDQLTNDYVAIKKVKFVFGDRFSDDQLTKLIRLRSLRELKILTKVDHPNIIALRDVILPPSYEQFEDLYLITDFMPADLRDLQVSGQILPDPHIKYITYQILMVCFFRLATYSNLSDRLYHMYIVVMLSTEI